MKRIVTGAFLILLSQAMGPTSRANFLVASYNGDTIQQFDDDGNFVGTFASGNGLDGPDNFAYGPDGTLYVSNLDTESIIRFDTSGNFLGTFASGNGLEGPTQLIFGPDGNLYVSSFGSTSAVLRIDGSTGAFIDTFASGGGLSLPRGLVFDDDDNLLVVSAATNSILRHDGSTGAFLGTFADSNLAGPLGLIRLQVIPGPSSLVLSGTGIAAGVILLRRRRDRQTVS